METTLRQRLNETGIGFAGIDGVWWLPATEPFRLPATVRSELEGFGAAVFAFLDTVGELYHSPEGASLRELLGRGVPEYIGRQCAGTPVFMLRPDFQLVVDGRDENGRPRYRPVATELEICPAAQGFAHAMQVAYGLEPDLTDEVARFLDGRPLLFAGSSQWSEFLFEQLAFCRALAERGVSAHVLYDRPIADLAAEVAAGARWEPPIFGVARRPPGWNVDVLGRIERHDLATYLWPNDMMWPESIGETVVFRFGYFDCFSQVHLSRFASWQASGATFLNPPCFYLESKVLLATLALPVVRERLNRDCPDALTALDRCLPETLLLDEANAAALTTGREYWVIKYAGYDGDDRAWGGRSLRFGRDHSAASWEKTLRQSARLPWPVVAQRLTPSAQIDIDYLDGDDRIGTLTSGTTRLRSFLLRGADHRAAALGVHLTVSTGAQVSEATDAVQAPVIFGGEHE